MANFIGLVYATLKNEGIDTSKMSTEEAIAKFKELQKKSGGKSGKDGGTPAENRKVNEIERKEKAKKSIDLMKSGKTPNNVKMTEFTGGTMDLDGNPINMEDFKDGYLVSCMNDSYEENREFIYNNPEFIEKFIEQSDDGKLYVGSWFENGKNNNEPTIWVKDKQKAIELAKKTGQYAITDCSAYNKYKCKNYEALSTDEQINAMPEIFISTANDEGHKIKLEEVDW